MTHEPLEMAVTILVGRDGAKIEVEDRLSSVRFLELELSAEEFTAALGRQAMVHCTGTVRKLERVGLKQEYRPFTFTMPEPPFKKRIELASAEAKRLCPDGWEPDLYFGSHDSFSHPDEDGQITVRIMMRRWVPVADTQPAGEVGGET